MPSVSVVIPTRNRRQSLQRALAGVDAQQFRDFEIIVVDDGSTDGTSTWLPLHRPDVILLTLPASRGAAAARNHGIARATGEFVAFLDDDDFWLPAYLAAQIAQFAADPHADLCTTGHFDRFPNGRLAAPDLLPRQNYPTPFVQFLAECPIHSLSVVACRRSTLTRTGAFDESLSIVHDLDLYLRLLAAGARLQHHPAPLAEKSVPGGLVTRHRNWFLEERAVHNRAFAAAKLPLSHQRLVRTARALLFARLALPKGDLTFGLARLAEAFFTSPLAASRILAVRFLRPVPLAEAL